jgi:hypothetical protein
MIVKKMYELNKRKIIIHFLLYWQLWGPCLLGHCQHDNKLILCFSQLLKDTVINGRMTKNDEFNSIWSEVVMTMVLSQDVPSGTEENQDPH